MNEFKNYHPAVGLAYFAAVIGLAMVLMHPVCLLISLVCAFIWSVMLDGKRRIGSRAAFLTALILLAALVNPAFSHEGVTVLAYLPSGNPLTLESVYYGLAAGMMLSAVITWFTCFNRVMTSDKILYLFGRVIPASSLVLSMVFRFVPRFRAKLAEMELAQKGIGQGASQGSVIKRAKKGLTLVSMLTTNALENSVETADSMKSRGYGLPGRSAFSLYTFRRRDRTVLVCLAVLFVYVAAGSAAGGVYFRYFPSVKAAPLTLFTVSLLAAYLLLCAMPIAVQLWEVRRWKAIKSNI